MLVTFRSSATESVTMFGEVASQLLHMMGATGRIPGAFVGEDVPDALSRLQAALARLEQEGAAHGTPAPPALNEDAEADEDDEVHEPPVELVVRAAPLLDLLRRAAAAKAEVSWEGK